MFCRAGNNPSATTPVTNGLRGTYLNNNSAVNCPEHNAVTSWHYCYYPSEVTPGQTYTMTVAVWRLDSSTNTYRVLQGSSRTISLVPVMTFAKIFCNEHILNSTDYIFILNEDIIGVVLPNTNQIPVVSSGADSSSFLIKHSQNMTASDLLSSEFTILSDVALHLYAKLGKAVCYVNQVCIVHQLARELKAVIYSFDHYVAIAIISYTPYILS